MGVEYLWGGQVKLETTELVPGSTSGEGSVGHGTGQGEDGSETRYGTRRVVYTMDKRKLAKTFL